jgi:hypothetical protein
VWAVINSRPWWIYAVFICFALGSQFLIASHQQSLKPDQMGAAEKSANAVSAPEPPVITRP